MDDARYTGAPRASTSDDVATPADGPDRRDRSESRDSAPGDRPPDDDDARGVGAAPDGERAPLSWSRVRRYLAAQRREFHLRLALIQRLVELIPFNTFPHLRAALYRRAGFAIQRNARIAGPLTIWGSGDVYSRLGVGEGTFINSPAHLELNAPVRFGARCAVGHHLVVITTNHHIGSAHQRAGGIYHDAVTVGNGVWIGARVTLLPGVTIGDGAFIAAGSMIVRDVPANAWVSGQRGEVVRVMDDGPPPPRRSRPVQAVQDGADGRKP